MKTRNLVHVTEYTQDGEKKKKYQKVGTLFIYDDGGMSMKLDYIPVEFNGNLSVYETKEVKTTTDQRKEQVDQAIAELKQEEIPF